MFFDDFHRRRDSVRELTDLDGQERQPLSDIVVKVPGNPPAFVLLCREQAPGERSQLAFAGAKGCLRLLPQGYIRNKRDGERLLVAGVSPESEGPIA